MSIYREKIVRYRETMRLELKPWDLVDLYHQINNLFDVLGITISVIVIGKFLLMKRAWRNYVKMKRLLEISQDMNLLTGRLKYRHL